MTTTEHQNTTSKRREIELIGNRYSTPQSTPNNRSLQRELLVAGMVYFQKQSLWLYQSLLCISRLLWCLDVLACMGLRVDHVLVSLLVDVLLVSCHTSLFGSGRDRENGWRSSNPLPPMKVGSESLHPLVSVCIMWLHSWSPCCGCIGIMVMGCTIALPSRNSRG